MNGSPTEDSDRQAIEEYRVTARGWLAENLEWREAPAQVYGVDHYTPDVMAANRTLQRRLFEGGYAGISWPVAYGGQGLPDSFESAFLEEAAAYVTPDFGALTATTFHICVPTMLTHGSPDFLRRFIPLVLAGEALVCQFFSEPSAGSDLAGIRTRATRDDGEWILNGQKVWSTLAHLADYGLCLARTDWEAPKHKGLTWFVVPCTSTGLTIRPLRQIGGSSEFCEEFFDNVVVPDSGVIGGVNEGWTVTRTMLVFERGAGRPSEGTRSGPGPLAPEMVRLAQTSGRIRDPVVRQKLARAHTIDHVGKVLASRLAEMARRDRLGPGLAAYGKLFRGTFMPIRARIGMEIGGDAAVTWDPADAHGGESSTAYLNGRAASIAGGTNEVQRNAIAEQVLGMPREPSFDTKKPFSQVLRDARIGVGHSDAAGSRHAAGSRFDPYVKKMSACLQLEGITPNRSAFGAARCRRSPTIGPSSAGSHRSSFSASGPARQPSATAYLPAPHGEHPSLSRRPLRDMPTTRPVAPHSRDRKNRIGPVGPVRTIRAVACSVIRVRAPGLIALTVTPYRANSVAAMRVNAAMPAFAAP